jgi:pimeloyl-ACP methyl ester carboxylesterase
MLLATHIAGEGSPVVLIHGLYGSSRNLGAIARALSATHRVLSLDMRNHGDSPHDPVVDYDTMAADVHETLQAAGLSRTAVLGHSMGGKIAMRLALRHPDMVSRLVVADIAPVQNPPNFDEYTRAMLALPPTVSRMEADAILAPAIPDKAVRMFLLHNFRSGAGWRIGLPEIAASLPDIEAWPPIAESYAGPTLFVTGARSGYVLPEHRPAIQALFPAVRFVAIKDAGHWLHSEQPAAFLATITPFFAAA